MLLPVHAILSCALMASATGETRPTPLEQDHASSLAPVQPPGGLVHFGSIPNQPAHLRPDSKPDEEDVRRAIERHATTLATVSNARGTTGSGATERSAMIGDLPRFTFFPYGGRLGLDFHINLYFDHDPDEGEISAYDCGNYTVDSRRYTQALVPSMDHKRIGIPAFSVLDGVVLEVGDDQDDENVEQVEGALANYVFIDHGDGLEVYYFSLKKDSVLVTPGQVVRAGEQIAEVAASGEVDWPVLRFWTQQDGVAFDPFTGECNPGESSWVDQPEMPDINDVTCIDFSVTTENLDAYYAFDENWRYLPPAEGYVSMDNDGIWPWIRGLNLPANSIYSFQFFDPAGDLHHDTGWMWLNFGFTSYDNWIWWFYFDLPGLQETPGTWQVKMFINGEQQIDFPLEIIAEGDPTPNRAPEPITTAIVPPNPTSDDVLSCEVTSAFPLDDLDWDLVRYRYIWSVDGVVVRDTVSAGLADFLPSVSGCGNPVVTCDVTPSDGVLFGPVSTAAVVVTGYACTADLDCDGNVGGPDLAFVLANWNSADPTADIDGSGTVDAADLAQVLGKWGFCQ